MNLLNLVAVILREFVHTMGMDSRCAHQRATPHYYFNFADSAFACFRIGMSGSASFHSVRKSRRKQVTKVWSSIQNGANKLRHTPPSLGCASCLCSSSKLKRQADAVVV